MTSTPRPRPVPARLAPTPLPRRSPEGPRTGPFGRLRSLARALLDLVVPVSCASCGRPGSVLCPHCRASLGGGAFPAAPVPAPAGLPLVVAAASYDGAVRASLLAHKERGVLRLAGPLGAALAGAVLLLADLAVGAERVGSGVGGAVLAPGLALVPVPSTRPAVRRRGHDPTLRIARAAARSYARASDAGPGYGSGHVRVVRALEHTRHVADQSGLDAAGRAANLSQALAVRPRAAKRLRGERVVVVDDLVRTGATLAEATRALRAAGTHVVGAAVVAATARRGPSPLDRSRRAG